MSHAITKYLPWLLSLVTVAATIMAGNLDPLGWALSALNQVLWFIWIMHDFKRNKGLLPMNLILTVIFIRNYLQWLPA